MVNIIWTVWSARESLSWYTLTSGSASSYKLSSMSSASIMVILIRLQEPQFLSYSIRRLHSIHYISTVLVIVMKYTERYCVYSHSVCVSPWWMPSVCTVHTQTSTLQQQQLLVLWAQAELTRAVTDSTVCCVCINWYVLLTIEYFSPSSWVSESSGYQNTCNLDSMHTHTLAVYATTITHCTQQHIYSMQCRGRLANSQCNYSGAHIQPLVLEDQTLYHFTIYQCTV